MEVSYLLTKVGHESLNIYGNDKRIYAYSKDNSV